MPPRSFTMAIAAALVAAAIGSAPAAAHTDVKSTSPKRNGSAKTSVRTVSVTFTGPIRRGTMSVTGPGSKKVSVGSGGRDPRKISRLFVGLKRGLKAGRYTARWTMVAVDGHTQRGSFRFKLRS